MNSLVSMLLSPMWAAANCSVRALRLGSRTRMPVPVISVGNIVAGGVGKTEIVNLIADHLISQGKRVTVSTRGYGSSWEQRSGYATDFESAHTQKFPDEALVLLKKTPGVAVAVGKRRVDTLKRNWENLRPDVIILDDGFQHFSMNRQIDVLVHNFEIRNPLFRDFPFWFNRAGLRVAFSDVPAKLNNGPPWVRVNYRLKGVQKVNSKLESIPRTANVFCGIGNPNRIRSFLERNGVKVNAMKVFRDHQDYHLADIEGLKKWNEKNGEFPLVTTLKDAVKLRDYAQCMGGVSGFDPLWLDIGVEILDHKEYFWRKLNESVALASDSGGP